MLGHIYSHKYILNKPVHVCILELFFFSFLAREQKSSKMSHVAEEHGKKIARTEDADARAAKIFP